MVDKFTKPPYGDKLVEKINDIIDDKQDTLVSGANIKTINNTSLLGSGNIDIQGGGTVTVDDALSTTSTNPVQNKVITTELNKKIEGISSSDVTTALGYTPYNSSNPNGYQANKIETIKVNGTAQTITSKAVDITVPTNNNQLTNGAGYITSSALTPYALSEDLADVATSGSYNDLSNKPTIPDEQVQSDWNVTNTSSKAYIKNKPTIPSAITVDTALSTTSTNPVQNKVITTELNKKIEGISSSDVTTALGYTPYNSSNPNGYTSNVGTITGIKMNGSSKGTSGVVDLGTVITAHQDISGKQDKITSTNKLSADLLSEGTTNKLVSATEKSTWNGKQNAITSISKLSADLISDGTTNKTVTATEKSTWNNKLDSSAISDMATKTWVGQQGYTSNVGTVTKVNNTSPDSNGNVTISIPSAVTESTVSGWGFTKNAGTITGITMNGSSKGTSGVVNLGTVITAHQDISGKENTTNKVTSLSASSTNTQYPSAKCVYDALQNAGGGSSRNIGEIVSSTIPLTDAGLHLLDGALIQGSGIYSAFVTYIAGLRTQYSSLFTTESDWQSTVAQYGVCGKFVYTPPTIYYAWYNTIDYSTVYTTQLTGSGADFKVFTISNGIITEISHYGARITNNVLYVDMDGTHDTTFERDSSSDTQTASVRLPKITGIIEGTTDLTALGDLVQAGLPNIAGHSPAGAYWLSSKTDSSTGPFYRTIKTSNSVDGQSSQKNSGELYFDASRSNSIYGNSDTVQPQTIKVLYYIVIATSTKTDIQVDIDEIATDLSGKADVDLTNTNNQAKILMAGMGMPSSTYVDLTLGASESTYTAPANGWFVLEKVAGTKDRYAFFTNLTNGITTGDVSYSTWQTIQMYIPVKKGDVIRLTYNITGTTKLFRFIYAQGSESEAS